MEFFNKATAVKLRSHRGKYLVADDDRERVRQSRNGTSRKTLWLVELVAGNTQSLRLKSCHGRYLTAANAPFLLGMTGNKVVQTEPDNLRDVATEWQPVREGFQVKLRAFGGTYLRANGGTPPWRNSVTHDNPQISSTHGWILWDLEAVDIPENEPVTGNLSTATSFSSFSHDLFGSELGSPVSMHSTNSLGLTVQKAGMDLFHNAKAVRLRSHHNKYLHAAADEESVTQLRDGSSKTARWTVEFVDGADNIIRLKSSYGKYLTASNQPFPLGMTGRKVLQTLPAGRLDSSVEWEPVREGNQVKLKTRYGNFLRGNGGVPPWRNSVTHDIPNRSATQSWILWDVHVVEIVLQSPHPKPTIDSLPHSDSLGSELSSPSVGSANSRYFGRQESGDSLRGSPPKAADGRTIYYQVADEDGNVDEGEEEEEEGHCITFNGNEVDELTRRLEEDTGLKDIIVCSRSPLNGKLYPLRLQLPPNIVNMHLVLLESSSQAAKGFTRTGIPM